MQSGAPEGTKVDKVGACLSLFLLPHHVSELSPSFLFVFKFKQLVIISP